MFLKRDKAWADKHKKKIRVRVRRTSSKSLFDPNYYKWHAYAWVGTIRSDSWGPTPEVAARDAIRILTSEIERIHSDWKRKKEEKWHEIDINHM
jgi:hypothetical protein